MNSNTLRGKECKVGQAGGWGIFAVLLPGAVWHTLQRNQPLGWETRQVSLPV